MAFESLKREAKQRTLEGCGIAVNILIFTKDMNEGI
jgi:hypothetical protein